MERRRLVLRYRGPGPKPPGDVERVRHLAGVTVVDESSARMLLVEGDDDAAASLSEALPDWVIAPEQSFAVPDVRKQVR